MVELAHRSGEVALRYFASSELGREDKEDETPVTRGDREAEELLRSLIEERCPDHGIIGEEYGSVRTDAEFVWVLDPIDGTKSYASAVPLYGTLIGLMRGGRPYLGAIHQPNLGWLLIGDGKETVLNGQPVRVRDCEALSQATLLATDPHLIRKAAGGALWDEIAAEAKLYRSWGDCFGYMQVATGWADVMLDPKLALWDKMALIPVMEGAGGIITDWEGNDAATGKSILATVPSMHSLMVKRLAGQA
ncbi:MAG: inositol monophosphatase family protein [Puniceicoccaceae bacterium]